MGGREGWFLLGRRRSAVNDPTWRRSWWTTGTQPGVAHLLWEVKRAEREAARTIDKVLRGTGLTKSQFEVLQALARMRVASSAELARTVFVTPQAMVGMIAALEQKGYIERNPAAESARIIEARLTVSGRAALKRSQEPLARVDECLRVAFNSDEAIRFSASLRRFVECLDHIDDADDSDGDPSQGRRPRPMTAAADPSAATAVMNNRVDAN